MQKHPVITSKKILDVYEIVINSVIQNTFSKFKLEDLINLLVKLEKDSIKSLNDISLIDVKDSKEVKHIMQSYLSKIRKLTKNFIDYKKIELINYYIGSLQYIINSFDYLTILKEINEDLIEYEDEDVFRKINIIEKVYNSSRYLGEKIIIYINNLENILGVETKISFNIEDIDNYFNNQFVCYYNINNNYHNKNQSINNNNNNNIDTSNNIDNFSYNLIYKYLLENIKTIVKLWKHKCSSIEAYHINNEKIVQLKKIRSSFCFLYGIHQYLHQINIFEIMKKIFNHERRINSYYENDYNVSISILVKFTGELELVISWIIDILNEKKDNIYNFDYFSNETIVMYATSILDNAYLKKVICIICYSLLQSKNMIDQQLNANDDYNNDYDYYSNNFNNVYNFKK